MEAGDASRGAVLEWAGRCWAKAIRQPCLAFERIESDEAGAQLRLMALSYESCA